MGLFSHRAPKDSSSSLLPRAILRVDGAAWALLLPEWKFVGGGESGCSAPMGGTV